MKNQTAALNRYYNLENTYNLKGLTSKEAEKRLKIYGKNELVKRKKISPLKIFFNQFSDFMTIILLLATFFSLCMGETIEALTIIFIVFLNAVLGFWQEFKTEKTLEALKNLAAPTAMVIREGNHLIIPAAEVVPGDIIIVEAGNRVPADAVLIEAKNLTTDESMLTGESIPVEKEASKKSFLRKAEETPTSNQTIFMGTSITSGKGIGIVINTGMNTEMGKIADMLQNIEEDQTPLQKRLEKMGKYLVYGCLILCGLVSIIGILKGESIFNMILAGISLSVAAIPEGLPAVVTISLAIGVQKMLKKNALIRRLPAVETLGCTTVICSDKTGTLTENKMVVRKIKIGSETFEITGAGFEPIGDFISNGKIIIPKTHRALMDCLTAGALCNNADLIKVNEKAKYQKTTIWSIYGDPTEGAILVAAAKAGITTNWLKNIYTRIHEIPFDSTKKMMTTVYKNNQGKINSFTKGAPDVIINLCSHFQDSKGIHPLDSQIKAKILNDISEMASEALRVIAVAKKVLPDRKFNENDLEKNLIFLGIMGMIDPPRKEAIDAIKKCKKAGIKTVMITGDHQLTAKAIAKDLGIITTNEKVITGDQIDKLNDLEFDKAVLETSVYARVSPRHKLKIVKSLKRNGHIVAMTGDGINDGPAVKEADIGISMGITGTDVTKESSSMILLDDNFSTIVSAVEEGRAIYDNIRKFIRYMLSCNIGEVLTMFLGTFLSTPVPLIPIQILWVNLVTDGLPGIALGLDPAEKDIMERKPRSPDEHIFSHGLLGTILIRGILIGLGTLAAFCIEYFILNKGLEAARTAGFTTLVISQLIHVFECRSETKDLFQISLFENKYLLWAVAISTIMLLGVLYIPYFQGIFKTVPLNLNDWMFVLGFSLAGPTVFSILRSLRSHKDK